MPKSTKKTNRKIKEIYLDYASATPVDPKVTVMTQRILKDYFANPSAIHKKGLEAKGKLKEARKNISMVLHSRREEVFFTSGATESNNLAILGVVQAANFLPHIVTTNIEHPSVLEVCRYLEREKLALVTYVNMGENGIVSVKEIKKAIKKNTVLVSVMYANNEIGTIQPIKEIAKTLRGLNKNREKKIIFHTDATQAINYLDINVDRLGVDLLSLNGGKIYGPKGIGALFIKKGTPVRKVFFGGDQEEGMRPGTENISGAVALAEALLLTERLKESESKRLEKLRDYFLRKLENSAIIKKSGMVLNGDRLERLPNNINITIPKIPSEIIVLELSARGIYISEKSACKSDDVAPSHVIRALRGDNLESVRFSLGRSTEKKDLDATVKALEEILKKLEKWY